MSMLGLKIFLFIYYNFLIFILKIIKKIFFFFFLKFSLFVYLEKKIKYSLKL